MDVFPKFIIESGRLTIGKVTFHKELVFETKEQVQGGGWFTYISEEKCFLLYGSSEDFGKAKFEDIKKAIQEGHCDAPFFEERYNNMDFRYSVHNRKEDALKDNIKIEKL